jgi:hypothetical protein
LKQEEYPVLRHGFSHYRYEAPGNNFNFLFQRSQGLFMAKLAAWQVPGKSIPVLYVHMLQPASNMDKIPLPVVIVHLVSRSQEFETAHPHDRGSTTDFLLFCLLTCTGSFGKGVLELRLRERRLHRTIFSVHLNGKCHAGIWACSQLCQPSYQTAFSHGSADRNDSHGVPMRCSEAVHEEVSSQCLWS